MAAPMINPAGVGAATWRSFQSGSKLALNCNSPLAARERAMIRGAMWRANTPGVPGGKWNGTLSSDKVATFSRAAAARASRIRPCMVPSGIEAR